jgi:Sulfotransferase domain
MINKKVVLWGIADREQCIDKRFDFCKSILDDNGIEIVAIVDPYICGQTYEGIKCISQESYTADYADTPIILLARTKDGGSAFERVFNYITKTLGIRQNIIHPLALIDIDDYICNDCVVVAGYPGSGNMLLLAAIKRLVALKAANGGCTKIELYRELENEYFEIVSKKLDAIFAHEYYRPEVWSADRMESRIKYYIKQQRYAQLLLPDKPYLMSKIHHTHEKPTKSWEEKCKGMGYRPILAVRNPLDVILASANKFEEGVIRSKYDLSDDMFFKNYRELYMQARLTNTQWFRSIAQNIFDYFTDIAERMDSCLLVKYESILDEPIETLGELSKSLGVCVDSHIFSNIWEEIGCKPLGNTGSLHFNKPGVDKWKTVFGREHYDILCDIGYPALLTRLGYDGFSGEHAKALPVEPTNRIEKDIDLMSLQDYSYKMKLDADVAFECESVIYREYGHAKLLTNDREMLDIFDFFMKKGLAEFLNILNIDAINCSDKEQVHKESGCH